MKSYAGLLATLSFPAALLAGCTSPISIADMAAPVDGDMAGMVVAPPPDLAVMATCTPACSGQLAYCDANHRCVACLTDDQCPAGNLCKNEACLPGCADDARCKGANPNSPLACCGGQCIDVTGDADNCGMCAMACKGINQSSACTAGACVAGACDKGWGDCNMDPKDGCETSLHVDPNNCGACGMKCSLPNGIAGCSDTCYLAACQFGWDDCDNNEANGCELPVLSDPKNCGACGNTCMGQPHSKASCVDAACQITSCDPGFTDCNNNPADGCEVATGTDASNCGKCGNVCGGNLVCINGGCTCQQCNIPNSKTKCVNNQCTFDSCVMGFGDCNNNPADGCEINLGNDKNNCGACGMVCPQNTPYCFQGICQAKLPGVLIGTINGQDYYKVQVMGAMTDTNVIAACQASGFNVPCQAQQGCNYNDNLCVMTQEKSCGNPMQTLAQTVCNGANPPQCPALSGCFQYMGHKWVNDSACGTQNGQWCIQGSQVQNLFAICVM